MLYTPVLFALEIMLTTFRWETNSPHIIPSPILHFIYWAYFTALSAVYSSKTIEPRVGAERLALRVYDIEIVFQEWCKQNGLRGKKRQNIKYNTLVS